MNKKLILRIFLWLFLVALIVWIAWLKIVPGGKMSLSYDFKQDNYFIGKLSPTERVEPIKNGSQLITGNPVYFSITEPRRFEKARLEVKYRIKGEGRRPKILETGVLTDRYWHYSLKPLSNSIIADMSQSWNVIKSGDLMLLQRKKTFNTIDEFLKHLPDIKSMAVYNYDIPHDFKINDYAASSDLLELPASLRANYNFYLYLKNETLNLQFKFLDLNKKTGADPIKIRILKGSELIAEKELNDDGDAKDDGQIGEPGMIAFHVNGLKESVYQVQVLAGDDIITKSLKTSNKNLAFINRIWFYEADQYPLKLFTDSDGLNLQTSNPASLQTVKINDRDVKIDEAYREYDESLKDKKTSIQLAKGDVVISGDGMFSFFADRLFNPEIKKLNPNFDPDKSGVNFLIARYKEPAAEVGWTTGTADFDLTNIYRENNKFSIVFSIPGLKNDSDGQNGVEIKEIKIDLTGKSLWQKLWEIFKSK